MKAAVTGVERPGFGLNRKKSRSLEREVERIAGPLQISLPEIQVSAVQHRKLVQQMAPAIRRKRPLIFYEYRLKRRYLAAITAGVHIRNIVCNQLKRIRLGFERCTRRVVAAVHKAASRE